MTAGAPVRFAVVGNPGNRRVTLFAAAVRAAGLPAPRVLGWREVLRGAYGFRRGEVVRIDSPGEDPQVDRLLRGADDPTRAEGGARWYARFTAAVAEVAGAAVDAGARLLDDPADLAVMFDKRRCHARLAAAGVPVPWAAGTPRSPVALRPRACPLAVCDCHIGYVHLESLPLYDTFAGGVLERVPAAAPVPAGPPGQVLMSG